MLGKALAEISPFPGSFLCCRPVSIQLLEVEDGDFRDFQFWRREPPYHNDLIVGLGLLVLRGDQKPEGIISFA